MADGAGADDATVTFHVKSSGGQKYTMTVPLSTTTMDLKNKLSSEEYANVPASAQRLIYSGKVLKDHETLASHNVKDGNTMHLVKSAASNQRQNPAAQPSTTNTPPSAAAPQQGVPGVPQNLSSGTGNDPLAGLTGARYAGFAQLPNASMFQENQSPEDFLHQLDNPHFQQMMREAMGNPQVQDMIIQQNPHLRALGPQARQMLNSDYFRSMMTNPQMLRNMMQMQQQMGMGPFGGGAGGQEAFPAPGVTNTTEGGTSITENTSNGQSAQAQQQQPQMDPFAMLQAVGNPFGNTAAQSGDSASQTPSGGQQQNQQPFNPFMALFPQAGQQAGGNAGTTPQQFNPFNPQTNPLLQNPEAMQQMMQMMMGGPQVGGGNDMGSLFNMFGGGGQPAAPPDNRPPEERYAQQLQQLNEMGFYDFDRNVQALRRTGGNVNGAIEFLLSNSAD